MEFRFDDVTCFSKWSLISEEDKMSKLKNCVFSYFFEDNKIFRKFARAILCKLLKAILCFRF